jgi:hypothetical protein
MAEASAPSVTKEKSANTQAKPSKDAALTKQEPALEAVPATPDLKKAESKTILPDTKHLIKQISNSKTDEELQ